MLAAISSLCDPSLPATDPARLSFAAICGIAWPLTFAVVGGVARADGLLAAVSGAP
jgi:hypothetical protein